MAYNIDLFFLSAPHLILFLKPYCISSDNKAEMISTCLLLVQKINEKKNEMKRTKNNLGAFNPFTAKGEFD